MCTMCVDVCVDGWGEDTHANIRIQLLGIDSLLPLSGGFRGLELDN